MICLAGRGAGRKKAYHSVSCTDPDKEESIVYSTLQRRNALVYGEVVFAVGDDDHGAGVHETLKGKGKRLLVAV